MTSRTFPSHTALLVKETAPEGRLYFQRTNTHAVRPLAFSTYSSIWLKFKYL